MIFSILPVAILGSAIDNGDHIYCILFVLNTKKKKKEEK